MSMYLKAAVYALFAAAGGATLGSLFDDLGEHTHAQTVALFAGFGAFIWRVTRGDE
jgi:hypothetical protein